MLEIKGCCFIEGESVDPYRINYFTGQCRKSRTGIDNVKFYRRINDDEFHQFPRGRGGVLYFLEYSE